MSLLSYGSLSCQFVVAGLFAVSAAGKARDRAAFRDSLESFGVSPDHRATVAAAVIAGEVAIVPLVLWPASAVVGFALAGALLVAFAVAIGRVVRAGQPVRCRCFGTQSAVLRPAHVWRNAGLVGVAAAGAALAAAGDHGAWEDAGGVLVTAVAALALLVLLAMFDDVVELVEVRQP